MRIGVDACCWANGRGYGRFTRELIKAMVGIADDEFILFADDEAAARIDLEAPNLRLVRVVQSASPTRAAAADGRRSVRDMLRFTRAVWREPLDVFFSPSVYTYFPLPPRLATVVAIHDAIAERFPQLTFASNRARLFWRGKVALALRQARLVLTVSDHSARDIETTLGVSRRKIRVAGEAAASIYRPSDSTDQIAEAATNVGLPSGTRWFVYVGGFNPHKHVDHVIRAHAALLRETGDRTPHLLLIGDSTGDVFHGNLQSIRRAITDMGTETLVHWTGFVPDEELRHLHSGALALLLPSECEGFGLPAVEAAACGTPVIATTESPLPDLLAGGGIFVKPRDEQALLDAMRLMACDEGRRAAMGQAALACASTLSWVASARAALDIIYEAAA